MPGRKYSAGSGYRYGFNGKENDTDISEGGQDYGMRVYSERLGRFLSLDPITDKFPELTPYQFASNRPIDGIDLDGKEWWKYILQGISPTLGTVVDKDVIKGFNKRAREFIQGFKSLPTIVEEYISAHTSSIPGGAYIKQQEARRKAIEKAIGEGGKAYAKELADLTKKALNGDKEAGGALLFEALLIFTPGADELGGAIKSLSNAGKAFKCVEYAAEFNSKIEPMLAKIGAKVETYEIQIGKDGLIGTPTLQLSDNGMHQFVVTTLKDGTEMVFDNLHPNGILKSEYAKELAGFTKTGEHITGEKLVKDAKPAPKKVKKRK